MAQRRNGRRGYVFPIRLTAEERAELELLQERCEGPRALGPWLVWAARAAVAVLPPRAAPKQVIPRRRRPTPVADGRPRRVLDLCAGSGAWSAPYLEAGYRVDHITLPDSDVRTYVPPDDVWGVLAAPPCDQFSLARNGHRSPRDFVAGMAAVNACVRITHQCSPTWWALENPIGMLSRFLGTPRDVFQPCDFGDPWTKQTALWGNFSIPSRGPHVAPAGGGPPCKLCDPTMRSTTWCSKPEHRAITPPGFARAFFEANP